MDVPLSEHGESRVLCPLTDKQLSYYEWVSGHVWLSHLTGPDAPDRSLSTIAAPSSISVRMSVNLCGRFSKYICYSVEALTAMSGGKKDNLSSHKDPAIRRAIRSAGAKLFYRPPYSPDLNPIEHAFSKLKRCYGKIMLEVS